jgi:hypothetical protein
MRCAALGRGTPAPPQHRAQRQHGHHQHVPPRPMPRPDARARRDEAPGRFCGSARSWTNASATQVCDVIHSEQRNLLLNSAMSQTGEVGDGGR